MPRQLTDPQEAKQEALQEQELRSNLSRIEEELSWYDPEGGWQFLRNRLEVIAQGALEALVYCPMDEISKYRERLNIVRHLAELPETLKGEQARIKELLDGNRAE